MKIKITALIALVLGLNTLALNAQGNSAVVDSSSKGKGFFVYADYFQYRGAGAPGELVASEIIANAAYIYHDLQTYWQDSDWSTSIPQVPSGDMVGSTIGYGWTGKSGSRHVIQGGVRAGTIDATIAETWIDDEVGYTTYSQDTDEYRIMYSYSPAKLKFLTIGIEYVYSSFKGTFRQTDVGTTDYIWDYGFKSRAHDLLAHATLKAPEDIKLFESRAGGLWLLPRVDVGLGYSLRSGTIINRGQFSSTQIDETISKDPLVLETTPTLGLTYTLKSSRIILDVGYRFRTDVGSSESGVDQKGVYARLGFSYNW